MYKRVLFLVCTTLTAFSSGTGSEFAADAPTQDIAIYIVEGRLGAYEPPRMIFCAWSNGEIAWSHDRLNGGPPYKTANIGSTSVKAALVKMRSIGVRDAIRSRSAWYGPDSQFTTISINDGGQSLKMESWHELIEARGTHYAGSGGEMDLDGRSLLHSLSQESTDYLTYRLAWLEARLAILDLVPDCGDPATISFSSESREGVAGWKIAPANEEGLAATAAQ